MSETTPARGRCLCGSIKVVANNRSHSVGACHCSMCSRWSGGPLMAMDCGTDVTFDGEENISVFNSSDWAERGFCKQCGSHLFYRLKESQQYLMPPGLFDDNTDLNFDHQVFIDEKPDWYAFANKTEDLTGAEVFAQYAPPTET